MTTSPPTHGPPADAIGLSERFLREVLAPMKATFIDKDEVIDLLGVALVARENVFLHGPPGTAKSAIVRALGLRLGGTTFEYLLTRFTEPSELFGPFDIRRLREGDLVTNTDGMLPEAHLVFLDELLNANSAILNGLLGVLNERVLRRGREAFSLPMVSAIGASNHLPEDEALGALFDRFLLRVRCENVAGEHLEGVLSAGWELERRRESGEPSFSIEDLTSLGRALTSVDLQPIRASFTELVLSIRRAGIELSDRRAVKMQRAVAASAILAGRMGAEPSDLWVFRYAWETEEQREILGAAVEAALRDVPLATAHPRAVATTTADPEVIAAELDLLLERSRTPEAGATTVALDRLQHLSARCQWVAGDVEREHLLDRIGKIRRNLTDPDGIDED